MVLENQRLDITDRVVGKLANNQINLLVEDQSIGRILFSEQGNQFELKSGYENDQQNRIYKYMDVTINPDQKYVDCDDENGWC